MRYDLVFNEDLVWFSVGVAAVWLAGYLLVRLLAKYGEQR